MPITYRTGNPPPPAESLALSPQVAHAIRIIGQDWQEDVLELVRLHRDYRVAEAASPKKAEIARQSNKIIGKFAAAVPSSTLTQTLLDRFTATDRSSPERRRQLADDLSEAEQVWRTAYETAARIQEIVSKDGIVAANNISAATNQFGSPLQRTWDDRAALPRRVGKKPGKKKGKAVQLARIVIQMATGKALPRLTGLRFGG